MRQPWWEWGMWMYRTVFTQTNGAGGAIVVDIVPIQGTTMIVVLAKGANDGTNTLDMTRIDEDNNEVARFVDVASAGSTAGIFPQTHSAAATSASIIDSTSLEARIFRADDKLSIFQTGAGASNDTLTIAIRALLSSAERPIVSKGRSTNQGDVTIGTPSVDMIR